MMGGYKKLLATIVIVAVVLVGAWFFYQSLSQQMAPKYSSDAELEKDVELRSEHKDGDDPNQSISAQELLEENPELKMLKRLQAGSNSVVNFYGKIVDQFGEPVIGAEISYSVPYYDVGILPAANRSEGRGSTKSDTDGVFQIDDAEGMYLIVNEITKSGYLVEGSNRTFIYTPRTTDQVVHKPDPASPVVFHAWKKDMAASNLQSGRDYWAYRTDSNYYSIPMEGSGNDFQVQFELLGDGEKPDAVRQWRATLKMDGGGLIETTDIFMFEAPESGYEPEWVVVANENDRVERKFYFMAKNGKVYGRVTMTLRGYYGDTVENRNKGFIDYEYALNPTGSRNLLPADE